MVTTICLTQRQQDLLHFIARYQHYSGGVSPSFAEMAAGCGAGSKSTISHLLEALEERGRIHRIANRARAIEILDRDHPVSMAPDGAPLFLVSSKLRVRFVGGKFGYYQTFSGARAS